MTPITLSADEDLLFGITTDTVELYDHAHNRAKLAEHLPDAMESGAVQMAFNAGARVWADDLYDKFRAELIASESPSRFVQTNRVHDLRDFAEAVAAWMFHAARVRTMYLQDRCGVAGECRSRAQPGQPYHALVQQEDKALIGEVAQLRAVFRELVRLLAARYFCTVQAVARNTPEDKREGVLREFLWAESGFRVLVAGLHARFGSAEDELARMRFGPGHAEIALRGAYFLIEHAIGLVEQLETGVEGEYVHSLQASASMAHRVLLHPYQWLRMKIRKVVHETIVEPIDADHAMVDSFVRALHNRVPKVQARRLQLDGPARFIVIAGK